VYEHYEPSERIFVDRVEYLDWMDDAIRRCEEQSVVLHIRGIGGIGKSTLLEHWHDTHGGTILLDCDRVTNFFDRLDSLAKAAVRLGIKLSRYDILWHIRQRFIMGVEPAKETGRQWAKELLQPIPFIGSLASIGSAITTVGAKLSPRLTGRFGNVGNWLQSRLGKNYIEKLLEVLWKDPHHAEFLYLDALLEDLNSRKKANDPVIILFDHFDDIDTSQAHWRYKGSNISEAELWYVFLSSLSSSVGVVASRSPAPKRLYQDAAFEEQELTELDEESSRVLLNKRGCTDESLQSRIANVSKGNPYIVNTICDMTQVCCATVEDAEELRAETLEGVHLKTWRKLFSEAEGLLYVVDRAGLVPYFNERILSVIAPEMKSEHWDRVQNLSFVKQIEDEKWTLHDLARDLVLAELDERLSILANEVAELLEKFQTSKSDIELLSLSLSAKSLASERETIFKAKEIADNLIKKWSHADVLTVLTLLELSSEEGHANLLLLKGRSLTALRRIVEAEHVIREALDIFRNLAADAPREFQDDVADTLVNLAGLYRDSSRPHEAEDSYNEALEIWRSLADSQPSVFQFNVALTLRELAWLLYMMSRPEEGETAINEALDTFRELSEEKPDAYTSEVARSLVISGAMFEASCSLSESEGAYQESLELYRSLAAKEPERFENYVAAVLNNLARLYHQTGRHSEAEDAFKEVVKLRRAGAERAPGTFRGHLAVGLLNYGWLLLDIQKMKVAESVFREANEIFTGLAVDAPDSYLNAVAGSQTGLGVLYRNTGRAKEAEKAFNSAIKIYREVTDKTPELYRDQLAYSLEQFGILMRKGERMKESEDAFREALNVFKDCLEEKSDLFRVRECTGTMRNLTILLRETNRLNEAESPIQDALSILRKNQKDQPEVFSRNLVVTLNSYAILLEQTGKTVEAEGALREAIELLRALTPELNIVYRQYLSTIFSNLAVLLRKARRQAEAETALHEAAELLERPEMLIGEVMEELEF
jgi:tetratricopeptide (TPR) repeat protein